MHSRTVPQPRYLRAKETLKNQIVSGKIAVGARLPGEKELARSLDMSPMTVNRALRELVDEGFLRREPGVGTFVISNTPRPATAVAVRVHVVFFVRIDVSFIEHDVYFSPLLQGLTVQGARRGCEFRFVWAYQPGSLQTYLGQLDPTRDRLALVAPATNWLDEVERIGTTPVPFVIVGAHWPGVQLPCVDVDNLCGAADAVEHLIDMGHQRIAMLYMWPETANTRDRIEGYRQAVARHGLPAPQEWCVEILETERNTPAATEKIKRLFTAPISHRPTAIVAGGHWLALTALRALGELGLRIPEEVSVVGFDDTVAASFLDPPLTTVRQPLFELGQTALELLATDKVSSQVGEPLLLSPELIRRHSTGPVGPASA